MTHFEFTEWQELVLQSRGPTDTAQFQTIEFEDIPAPANCYTVKIVSHWGTHTIRKETEKKAMTAARRYIRSTVKSSIRNAEDIVKDVEYTAIFF